MKFNFETDNESQFRIRMDGTKFHAVLHNLFRKFRDQVKYNEDQETTWEEVQELFLNELASENVDIFDY